MRIRTIKPEFWKSPKVASVPWGARLVFAGLISLSDDEGRFVATPRYVASELFPFDAHPQTAVSKAMSALCAVQLVVTYEHAGVSYGFLPGFTEHQRIEKPKPSKLPPPPASRTSPGTSPGLVADESSMEGKGREGKGKEQGREGKPPPGETAGQVVEQPTRPPAARQADNPALAGWYQFQDRRKRLGLMVEKAPPPDSFDELWSWWLAMREKLCGGADNDRYIEQAIDLFFADDFWRAKGFPFNGFKSQWFEYGNRVRAA